jgi:hypothetical protein
MQQQQQHWEQPRPSQCPHHPEQCAHPLLLLARLTAVHKVKLSLPPLLLPLRRQQRAWQWAA